MSGLPKPKKKRFYRRWWFWTLLVLGAVVVLGAVAGAGAFQQAQRDALNYLEETATVEKRNLVKTINTDGEVMAEQSTQLSVATPARVTEVNYQVGDEVNKDDVLVKTDGGEFAGDEEVKAPFDGRVLAVTTFQEDNVAPGVPVVEIGYRSNHVEFIASEAEVIDLEVGQSVRMTVPSFNNGKDEFTGEVKFVDVQKQTVGGVAAAAGGTTEQGYLVEVTADNLPEEVRNVIGLSVDLTVEIEEIDDVVSIEPSAIQYDDDDEPFVYLPPTIDDSFIQRAMQAEEITEVLQTRNIEVGFEGDEYYEVEDGLREGEQVLLFIPSNAGTGLFQ